MYKTVKSLTCFLIDPHKSLSAVTAAMILALSNSGQLRSSHSTAHWINVLLHPLVNTMATSPAMTARRSSAAAFQAASSAEKMAVSVRIDSLFQKLFVKHTPLCCDASLHRYWRIFGAGN
jgi:hypothetical protein